MQFPRQQVALLRHSRFFLKRVQAQVLHAARQLAAQSFQQ